MGQILPTNEVKFLENQNGMAVAVELLSSYTPGGPVVDDHNQFVGFIGEFDLLHALKTSKDLSATTVFDFIAKDRISIIDLTPIGRAIKIMEEKRLLNVPVEREG